MGWGGGGGATLTSITELRDQLLNSSHCVTIVNFVPGFLYKHIHSLWARGVTN